MYGGQNVHYRNMPSNEQVPVSYQSTGLPANRQGSYQGTTHNSHQQTHTYVNQTHPDVIYVGQHTSSQYYPRSEQKTYGQNDQQMMPNGPPIQQQDHHYYQEPAQHCGQNMQPMMSAPIVTVRVQQTQQPQTYGSPSNQQRLPQICQIPSQPPVFTQNVQPASSSYPVMQSNTNQVHHQQAHGRQMHSTQQVLHALPTQHMHWQNQQPMVSMGPSVGQRVNQVHYQQPTGSQVPMRTGFSGTSCYQEDQQVYHPPNQQSVCNHTGQPMMTAVPTMQQQSASHAHCAHQTQMNAQQTYSQICQPQCNHQQMPIGQSEWAHRDTGMPQPSYPQNGYQNSTSKQMNYQQQQQYLPQNSQPVMQMPVQQHQPPIATRAPQFNCNRQFQRPDSEQYCAGQMYNNDPQSFQPCDRDQCYECCSQQQQQYHNDSAPYHAPYYASPSTSQHIQNGDPGIRQNAYPAPPQTQYMHLADQNSYYVQPNSAPQYQMMPGPAMTANTAPTPSRVDQPSEMYYSNMIPSTSATHDQVMACPAPPTINAREIPHQDFNNHHPVEDDSFPRPRAPQLEWSKQMNSAGAKPVHYPHEQNLGLPLRSDNQHRLTSSYQASQQAAKVQNDSEQQQNSQPSAVQLPPRSPKLLPRTVVQQQQRSVENDKPQKQTNRVAPTKQVEAPRQIQTVRKPEQVVENRIIPNVQRLLDTFKPPVNQGCHQKSANTKSQSEVESTVERSKLVVKSEQTKVRQDTAKTENVEREASLLTENKNNNPTTIKTEQKKVEASNACKPQPSLAEEVTATVGTSDNCSEETSVSADSTTQLHLENPEDFPALPPPSEKTASNGIKPIVPRPQTTPKTIVDKPQIIHLKPTCTITANAQKTNQKSVNGNGTSRSQKDNSNNTTPNVNKDDNPKPSQVKIPPSTQLQMASATTKHQPAAQKTRNTKNPPRQIYVPKSRLNKKETVSDQRLKNPIKVSPLSPTVCVPSTVVKKDEVLPVLPLSKQLEFVNLDSVLDKHCSNGNEKKLLLEAKTDVRQGLETPVSTKTDEDSFFSSEYQTPCSSPGQSEKVEPSAVVPSESTERVIALKDKKKDHKSNSKAKNKNVKCAKRNSDKDEKTEVQETKEVVHKKTPCLDTVENKEEDVRNTIQDQNSRESAEETTGEVKPPMLSSRRSSSNESSVSDYAISILPDGWEFNALYDVVKVEKKKKKTKKKKGKSAKRKHKPIANQHEIAETERTMLANLGFLFGTNEHASMDLYTSIEIEVESYFNLMHNTRMQMLTFSVPMATKGFFDREPTGFASQIYEYWLKYSLQNISVKAVEAFYMHFLFERIDSYEGTTDETEQQISIMYQTFASTRKAVFYHDILWIRMQNAENPENAVEMDKKYLKMVQHFLTHKKMYPIPNPTQQLAKLGSTWKLDRNGYECFFKYISRCAAVRLMDGYTDDSREKKEVAPEIEEKINNLLKSVEKGNEIWNTEETGNLLNKILSIVEKMPKSEQVTDITKYCNFIKGIKSRFMDEDVFIFLQHFYKTNETSPIEPYIFLFELWFGYKKCQ